MEREIISAFTDNTFKEKIVIALGFFDSVHKGHKLIIQNTVELAKELNACPCIFTFKNSPYQFFNSKRKMIFSFDQRVEKYRLLKIKKVIYAISNEEFFSLSAKDFISQLFANFNVVGIVSGSDYRFGYGAIGTCKDLHLIAKEKNIVYKEVDLLKYGNIKIATREIYNYLKSGDVKKLNKLLAFKYSLSGIVLKGRGVGRKYNFPTANISLDEDIASIKEGVYKVKVKIEGEKAYKLALCNVGTHPTFSDNKFNIETYILDFDKDIYGKRIDIIFLDYIRDLKKYDSAEDLYSQIKKDIEYIGGSN